MPRYAEKREPPKTSAATNAHGAVQRARTPVFQLANNRPDARVQRQVQRMADKARPTVLQRKVEGADAYDAELRDIIGSLTAMLDTKDVQADPQARQEITHYIKTASDVLSGDDLQAKRVLVESATTGSSGGGSSEPNHTAGASVQKKANDAAPVQRVVGLVVGVGVLLGIGYGIYRRRQQNQQRVARPPLAHGVVQDIPTTRAAYGETLALGGLSTRERTNEEIQQEVIARTTHNHNVLYQQLIAEHGDQGVTDIAQLIQGVRDNEGLCPGALCHDLTRYLVQQRTQVRPRIEELSRLTGATRVVYDLNGDVPLETVLQHRPPGTSVYLGSANALSGHTFTVVGENQGRVIVADRQPANPVASLKYASTVEAEARLSRNLNPGQQGDIDREFSGQLLIRRF